MQLPGVVIAAAVVGSLTTQVGAVEVASADASAILQSGVIPTKAARDAAHIAVSAVHGIDFLLNMNLCFPR